MLERGIRKPLTINGADEENRTLVQPGYHLRRGLVCDLRRAVFRIFLDFEGQSNKRLRTEFCRVVLDYLICSEVVIDELEAGIGIEPAPIFYARFGLD